MDTWSYRILGCDDGFDLLFEITEFVVSRASDEELDSYPQHKLPEERERELILSAYEDLKYFVKSKSSRLAYMILGMYLMNSRIKIDEELKKKILKYSDWKYEKAQIRNEKHRIERKKNLEEFRGNIIRYDGTEEIPLHFDTVTSVINRRFDESDSSPIKLKNIDYSIKE